ncbi:MAG: SH3 domain-containing protein [Anaerolineae bacterium]|nr:SH3 domain-containing protein [Anaerolineae bacterium]
MNKRSLSLINRRHISMMLVGLVVMLVVLLSGAGVASAETFSQDGSTSVTGPVAMITTGRLNVRNGPGPGYASVGILSHWDKVILLGRTTNNGWVKIAVPDSTVEGWISTLYIEAEIPVSTLPALAVADPWAIVTAPLLNVRAGPGFTHSVITTISKGKLITLVGRTADRAFAEILTDGIKGWVSTYYLAAGSPISNLPVTWVETATPIPTFTFATPLPTPTLVLTLPTTPVPTATPLQPNTTATAVPAVPASGPPGTITTGRLNVRSGPGPGYGIVETVSHWDTVYLLGRTGDMGWLYIQVSWSGTMGWVGSRYVETEVLFSSLPVLAQAPPWAVVKTGLLNVRSGPGTDFDVVTTVYQGRLISLIGRTADNSWVKVVANGVEGWATTLHISASAPISTLPIQ